MEQGRSIEQMVQLESQTQASDQVSVSHSIASLRFLSAMNWKDFVESLSAVESVLRSDPAKVYATMDFTTRDRYRHSVEFFARYGDLSESDVAARAVQLAARGDPSTGGDERRQHVGYYLIDKGQAELGRNVKVRWPWRALLEHGIHRFPLLFYAGGILSVTSLTTLLFISWAAARSVDGWRLVFLGIACLFSASQLGVGFMNWISTVLIQPRLLPRLDYSSGIPPASRTMVVVPTMLTSLAGVDKLLETLEIHHLSNRDSHLHFSLLTDYPDSDGESAPDDIALLHRARDGVHNLNTKYGLTGRGLFFLFHRPRRWNPTEGLKATLIRQKIRTLGSRSPAEAANIFSPVSQQGRTTPCFTRHPPILPPRRLKEGTEH